MAGTGIRYIFARISWVLVALVFAAASAGTMLEASSAVDAAKASAVSEAKTLAAGPLADQFSASDVQSTVDAAEQKALSQKIASAQLQPNGLSAVTIFNTKRTA